MKSRRIRKAERRWWLNNKLFCRSSGHLCKQSVFLMTAGKRWEPKRRCLLSCEHNSCHQASEARQRAAEYQPRAEEAELQDYSKRNCFFVQTESLAMRERRGVRQLTRLWTESIKILGTKVFRYCALYPGIPLWTQKDTEGFTGPLVGGCYI